MALPVLPIALAAGAAYLAWKTLTGEEVGDGPEPDFDPTAAGVAYGPALEEEANLRWPVNDTPPRITSPFGPRTNPLDGSQQFHPGVDIGEPEGTPIFAAGAGVVARTYYSRGKEADPAATWWGYGWRTIIAHGSSLFTTYNHQQSEPLVRPGERVSKGQQIGLVGSTGGSTGAHLHFEIVRADPARATQADYLDPAVLLG